MRKSKSSKIFLFFKLGIGIGVITFFLFWLDINKILMTLSEINLAIIIALFIIYVFDRLFMTYKWGLLIKSFKQDISFWTLAKAYFYGSFASQFMPVSISGEVVRFYAVFEDGLSRTYLFSSIVIEKIIGFFSMVVAGFIAIALYSSPLSNNNFYNGVTIAVFLLLCLSIFLFLIIKKKILLNLLDRYHGRFRDKILKIISSFRFFSQKKNILLKFFFYSLVEQILPVISIYILAHALDINISFLQVLFVTSLGLLLARLPISPSSIGIQEGAFVGLFILIGLSGELGFALSISIRILDMIYPLPFILIYLSETVHLLKKSKNEINKA